MSSAEINQVLAQMRAMATQAQSGSGIGSVKPIDEPSNSQFATMLQQTIDSVNDSQMKSKDLQEALQRGEPNVSLAEVMIASQKAKVSFEAVSQVRNRLVEAYKSVLSMPM